MQSSTPQVKTEQNIFAALSDNVNIKQVVKGEGKYPESLSKPAKRNSVKS